MINLTKTKDYELDCDIKAIKKAKWVELKDTVTGNEPKLGTKFCALESEKFLYLTFVCKDDYMLSTMTKYNDKLYDQDVVEFFIAAEHNLGKYLEIEVSPTNVQFLGLIYNNLKKSRRLKLLKRSFYTSNTLKTNEGYITQIKLPLKDIYDKLGVKINSPLVVNAYRIDRPQEGGWELSALNPTGAENFHVPSSFVRLKRSE